MSSFDAIFLHGVMDYSRGARPGPAIPDFKDLTKRLGDVQSTLENEDSEAAGDVSNIASDFDYDNELEVYVDRSYETIDNLHRGIRDACAMLSQDWDPDNMSRDEMVQFVETLQGNLEENLPGSKFMKDIAHAWFGYYVGAFVHQHHHLRSSILGYRTDDMYHGYLRDDKLGRLNIKACSGGTLRLETDWLPGNLVFTSDNKIVLGDNNPLTRKAALFAMPLVEFISHFEDWAFPTDEEMALFDVLHPGADWTVFKYLRDFEDKNVISNHRHKAIETSKIISVTTSL